MAKPTDLPEWATDGVYVTAPTETQKETGYATAKPHRGNTNWLFNRICQWLAYLDAGQFVGRITASQGFEAADDEHISVLSGGRFTHDGIITNIPVQCCVPGDGAVNVNAAKTLATTNSFTFELPQHPWRRLIRVQLSVTCLTPGETWEALLKEVGGGSSIATSGVSSGTLGATTDLLLTPSTQPRGSRYVVTVQRTGGGANTAASFSDIQYVYDAPQGA